jgi:hypothetical protein
MTVVNRLFGEDPGASGPAKKLPRPLADLEKAATGPRSPPAEWLPNGHHEHDQRRRRPQKVSNPPAPVGTTPLARRLGST